MLLRREEGFNAIDITRSHDERAIKSDLKELTEVLRSEMRHLEHRLPNKIGVIVIVVASLMIFLDKSLK
jgi:hypothetical protein